MVYSSQRNAVDLEWSSDQESALFEVLEEDHSLASEAASEKDQDLARFKFLGHFCISNGFASLELPTD